MKHHDQEEVTKKQKIITNFANFRIYCKALSHVLNTVEGYCSSYKASSHPLLKDHDGEYLEIQHHGQAIVIKINILYSLPYQIPILLFNAYTKQMMPIQSNELQTYFPKLGSGSILSPQNVETGVYITQNPITKEYMHTLHSCELSLQINYLVPYYLSLLGLHPEITKLSL